MSKEEILWLFVFIFIFYVKYKRENIPSSFNELPMSNKNKFNLIYLFLGFFIIIYLISYFFTFFDDILRYYNLADNNNKVNILHLNCNINNIHIFYDINCLAIILHRTIMLFIFSYINYNLIVFFKLIESNINRMRTYTFKELILENDTIPYYFKRFSYTFLFNYLINYIFFIINYRHAYSPLLIIDMPIILNLCSFIYFKRILGWSIIIMILDFFVRQYNNSKEFRKYVKRFIYIFIINHLTIIALAFVDLKNYNLSDFIVAILYNYNNILFSLKFAIIAFICDFFIKRAKARLN